MLSETANICFLSTIFVISFGYCKRECRRSSSSASSKSSRKITLLWYVARIDIIFAYIIRPIILRTTAASRVWKKGQQKIVYFQSSQSSLPPKIPFFKSWTRFSVSRLRFEFDTGRLVTGKTGIKDKNLSKQWKGPTTNSIYIWRNFRIQVNFTEGEWSNLPLHQPFPFICYSGVR